MNPKPPKNLEALLSALADKYRQSPDAPLPLSWSSRLLQELSHHPLSTKNLFVGLNARYCDQVAKYCSLWRLEEAYQPLCEMLSYAFVQTRSDRDHALQSQCTVMKALARYGPREPTLSQLHTHTTQPGHPNRTLFLRHLLLWRQPLPASVDLKELFSLAFDQGDKRSQKRAKHHLYRRFDLNDKEHVALLSEHAETRIHRTVYRGYAIPQDVPEFLLYPEVLFLLGASAPGAFREAFLRGFNRQAFEEYMTPVYSGFLRITRGFQSYTAAFFTQPMRRGAAHREQLEQEDTPLPTNTLLEDVVAPRQRIRQTFGKEGLLQQGPAALSTLHVHLQRQPAYQPGPQPRGFGASLEPIHFIRHKEQTQQKLGRIFGRLLFSQPHTETERMSALRELLGLPINDGTWSALITFLDNWCRHESFDETLVYPYVEEHLAAWPDELREAPRRWWGFHELDIRARPWRIIRRIDFGGNRRFSSYSYNIESKRAEQLGLLFAQSELIPRCTQLFLHHCQIGPSLLQGLLTSPQLNALTLLNIDNNKCNQSFFTQLTENKWLPSLTHLSYRDNGVQQLTPDLHKKAEIEHILVGCV